MENTMDLRVERLSEMTPEQERQFWEQFESENTLSRKARQQKFLALDVMTSLI
jgi:hypothetical protein